MAAIITQPNIKSGWDSGICDCGKDISSCCYGFWCCPCFMCTTSGDFGENVCLPLLDICGPGIMAAFGIPFCVPPVSLGLRIAVRHKYDIGGSICEDIMVTCCCIWCSWCQMSREIKFRKQAAPVVTLVQPIPMATTTQVITTQQQLLPMAPVQTVTVVK